MKGIWRFIFFGLFIGLIYWAVQFYDVRVKVPQPVEFQSAKEVVEDIKGPGGAGIIHKEGQVQTEVDLETGFVGTLDDIISLANEARKAKNISPLEKNEQLMQSALLKAQDMKENDYFEHVSPSGLDMSYFVGETGYEYSTIGENLAEGYFSATDVHNAWMNSEGHRENILSPDFKEIGVAVLQIEKKEGYTSYISVQHFGTKFSTIKKEPAAVVCDKKVKQRCDEVEEQREKVKDVIEEQEEIIEEKEDEGYSKKDLRALYENLDNLEEIKDDFKDYLEDCDEFIENCDKWK